MDLDGLGSRSVEVERGSGERTVDANPETRSANFSDNRKR
jgi:hypothetical protein